MSPPCIARLVSLWLLALLIHSAWGESPPRKDDFGDPLPAGAQVRIGTIRWRTDALYQLSSALGKDGRSLFVGSGEVICVFDLDTGLVRRTIKGPKGGFNCLALSPDGKTLAAAGYEGAALYDVGSGNRLRPLKVKAVAVLAFSPDGKRILTGGQDHERSVRLFDVAGGKEQLRLLW